MGRTSRTPPHLRTRGKFAHENTIERGERAEPDLCPIQAKVSYRNRGDADRAARRVAQINEIGAMAVACPGMGHWHVARRTAA